MDRQVTKDQLLERPEELEVVEEKVAQELVAEVARVAQQVMRVMEVIVHILTRNQALLPQVVVEVRLLILMVRVLTEVVA